MVSTSNSLTMFEALDAFTVLFSPENPSISLHSNVSTPLLSDIASVLIFQFLFKNIESFHTGFGSTIIPFQSNVFSNK
jgi:hypothetical protein